MPELTQRQTSGRSRRADRLEDDANKNRGKAELEVRSFVTRYSALGRWWSLVSDSIRSSRKTLHMLTTNGAN